MVLYYCFYYINLYEHNIYVISVQQASFLLPLLICSYGCELNGPSQRLSKVEDSHSSCSNV